VARGVVNRLTAPGRIYLIFLAFALLVVLSVGATFWSIQTQEMDALVINLAGRQSMLTPEITWLALAQPENPELQASLQLLSKPCLPSGMRHNPIWANCGDFSSQQHRSGLCRLRPIPSCAPSWMTSPGVEDFAITWSPWMCRR